MKKKIVIIFAIILVAVAAVISFLLLNKKENIVVRFDVDGGKFVQEMNIEKGSTIKLPSTEKDGYIFEGWYLDDTKVTSETTFKKDTTLKAKWIQEGVKTFTITFDSAGGSKVSSMTVECGTNLKLPQNPTKKGYTFGVWLDKNEVPILDGALLACEDIYLTARWEKEELVKNYTCPKDYKLNGTKCTQEIAAEEKCVDRGYDYNGKCVTITGAVRKDPVKTCGKTTVHTGGGHTEEVQGELFTIGTNYCFYKVVPDSYEQNQSNCISRGHKWNSINNKCYYARGEANENIANTCSDSGYAYISNPNSYEGVNGLNGGCYPISDKTKYCKFDEKLNGNVCIKTVDATLQEQ